MMTHHDDVTGCITTERFSRKWQEHLTWCELFLSSPMIVLQENLFQNLSKHNSTNTKMCNKNFKCKSP